MERSVECTHCGVVMTSWSAPGSPIRYFQCPFCARTHSSLYGEVFRRRAGARELDLPARRARPTEIPMASQEDVRWARVKAIASRWFARLEEDEAHRRGERPVQRRVVSVPGPLAARRPKRADAVDPELPEVDPSEVIEIAPAANARKR